MRKQYIRMFMTCKTCRNRWSERCPIRVWERNEGNADKNIDVDMDKDFCSKYEKNGVGS